MTNRSDESRLRVSHFFLFATACAISVAMRNLWTEWEYIPAEIEAYAQSHVAYFSLLYGVALGCLCLLAWQRWRTGQSSVSAPGHWYLLFAGTAVLLDAAVNVAVWLYGVYSTSTNTTYYAWHLEKILICGSVALTCWLFALKMNCNWWWKSVLLFPGIVLFLLVPQHFFALWRVWRPWFETSHLYAQILATTVVFLLLAVALWKDLANRGSHDWLHWVGVGIMLLYSIGGFVSAVGWLNYYA